MPRADFEAAVHGALEAISRQQPLDRVELARSLMVQRARKADPGKGFADVLRRLLRQAIDELGTHRRGDDLVAVVHHTYLEPAPKQRAAAHEAGLAYGTYRRRLREAIALLTERLWQWERAASNPDIN
jgi:hypothetical protein